MYKLIGIVVVLLIFLLSGCVSDQEQWKGTVTRITDLYALNNDSAPAGYYLRAQELIIDQKRFIIPYTGYQPSIEMSQIKKGQMVQVHYNAEHEVSSITILK